MPSFLRSDLAQLVAYTPQPGHGEHGTEEDGPTVMDHLDTNESPFDLPDALKQKLTWHYQKELQANRYPDGSHDRLKGAIAQYVTEAAELVPTSITTEHISVGNGSDELIRSILIATCLNGNGSILVAQPTFSMYGIVAQTLGIPVVTVDRNPDTFAIDCDTAQAAIEAPPDNHTPPVRVVFVVHPNSPTANALTETELQWLRQLPEDVLVVIDEAYYEFSQTSVVTELNQHPNWLITRTFSKAFRLAAHRVGYSVAHPKVTATFEKIRLPYNLPSFSQAAAQVALTHRQDLLGNLSEIWAERDRLTQALTQLPSLRTFPTQANFVYAKLVSDNTNQPSHAQSETMAQIVTTLRTQGTLLRHTGGGLRITVGTPAENDRTIQRLRAFLTGEI